jgi:hypothetical protein
VKKLKLANKCPFFKRNKKTKSVFVAREKGKKKYQTKHI